MLGLRWPSCEEAAILDAGRPIQLRRLALLGRRDLVGLARGLGIAGEKLTVDSVGIAEADLLETCPGPRGGGRLTELVRESRRFPGFLRS